MELSDSIQQFDVDEIYWSISMKRLTIILVADNNECDIYVYDYDYSKNDTQLVSRLMDKSISVVKSSQLEISLRSTFSELLKNTPLEYNTKYSSLPYRSLPSDIKLSNFNYDAKVVQIMLCDFSTHAQNACNIKLYPSLYSITCRDGIDVDKPIIDVISNVAENKAVKTFYTELYSVVRSDGGAIINPSIGNLERFRKIAENECLKIKDTVYVKEYPIDGNINIVYVTDYVSPNHMQVHKINTQEHSDIAREAFRANHFELRIDDKDYLRLACAKVDVQEFEHSCKILASFYLNRDTRALLASCLYSIGTKHKVDLTLYNHDSSISHHYGTATMKINKKHFSCDVNSDGTPLFIEILFISCSE